MATVMQQDVFNLGASQTDTESLRQKNIQGFAFFSDESRFEVPEDRSDISDTESKSDSKENRHQNCHIS